MSKKKRKGRPSDQPLVVRIEGQHLVVRIGIATLKFCSHAEEGGPLPEGVRVIHGRMWVKDVLRALLHEAEDGTNLINYALDRGIERACDDGSVALHFPPVRKPQPEGEGDGR